MLATRTTPLRRAFRATRVLTLLAALLGLALPGASPAAAQPDPAVLRLIRVMMTEAGTAPPPAAVAEAYDLLARAVGSSARALSHPRAITGAVNSELGAVMMESPAVRTAAQRFFRDMPGHSIRAVRTYLGRFTASGIPAVQQAIAAEVPERFTVLALDAAYALSQTGGGTALSTVIHSEVRAGLAGSARGLLGRFLARVGSSLGIMVEWLASQTAQRILGIHAIGSFTQAQINAALWAFQDEMEAIGDASEAEAFNNNLRLMLESLEDGRSTLAPGMTLAQAVRQLRRNINLGGSYFGNILVSSGAGNGAGAASGSEPASDSVGISCNWAADGTTCLCNGVVPDGPMPEFHCEMADAMRRVFEEGSAPPSEGTDGFTPIR